MADEWTKKKIVKGFLPFSTLGLLGRDVCLRG